MFTFSRQILYRNSCGQWQLYRVEPEKTGGGAPRGGTRPRPDPISFEIWFDDEEMPTLW